MNEKEKYNFVPVTRKSRSGSMDSGNYTVSIGKMGTLYIGNNTLKKFFGEAKFVKIYFDQDQRTVALLPTNVLNPGDKNFRIITKNKNGGTILSLCSIAKVLQVFGKTLSELELKEYVDKLYGKLYVFKIPK